MRPSRRALAALFSCAVLVARPRGASAQSHEEAAIDALAARVVVHRVLEGRRAAVDVSPLRYIDSAVASGGSVQATRAGAWWSDRARRRVRARAGRLASLMGTPVVDGPDVQACTQPLDRCWPSGVDVLVHWTPARITGDSAFVHVILREHSASRRDPISHVTQELIFTRSAPRGRWRYVGTGRMSAS